MRSAISLAALLFLLGCTSSEPPADVEEAAAAEAPEVAATGAPQAADAAPAPKAPDAAQVAAAPAKAAQPPRPLSADGLNRGDPAADFTGKVVYGGSGDLTLSSLVGAAPAHPRDGAIVAFGASWCGYCKASLPTLKTLQADNPNLAIVYVGIDSDDEGWQREIALFKERELNFPLVRVDDPDALRRQYFGNKHNIPRFYLVDHAGTVRIKDQGFTLKKMGKLLPKQVRYLLSLAPSQSAPAAKDPSAG